MVPKSMGLGASNWMGKHGKTYLCHQRSSGFLQLLMLPPSDGNSRTLPRSQFAPVHDVVPRHV